LDPEKVLSGSRIPNQFLGKLGDNFSGKNTLLKFCENYPKFFSLPVRKKHNFQFCGICVYKKGRTTIFSPFSFVAVVGCWIRDPRFRDPGWIKTRVRDKHPGSATLQFEK
jgi:hypothetical protein